MPYTYDPIFAADPNNPAMVAKDAAITIFDPAVPGVPVTITDPTGAPLPNPITVNAAGFGPAFQHATLDRVGWSGGGFSNFLTSYEGMKEVATEAKAAAQEAAGTAGQAAVADVAARVAAGQFKGEKGADGSNVLPTDDAIEAAIKGAGTKTKAALNATFATKEELADLPTGITPLAPVASPSELLARFVDFGGGFMRGAVAGDSTVNDGNDPVRKTLIRLGQLTPTGVGMTEKMWNGTSNDYPTTVTVKAGTTTPSVGGTVLTDNFNRTAAELVGSTTSGGQVWAGAAGGWSADGSQATSTVSSGAIGFNAATKAMTATAVCNVVTTSPAAASQTRLVVGATQVNFPAGGSYVWAQLILSTAGILSVAVWKRISGVQTEIIASVPVAGVTSNSATPQSVTLKLDIAIQAVTLTVTVGGVDQVLTGTVTEGDNGILGTYAALSMPANANSSFKVDSVTVATPFTPGVYTGLEVWNAAVGGTTLAHQQARLATMYPSGTKFDWLLVTNGHNGGTQEPAAFIAEVDAFVTAFKAAHPETLIVISSQNPQFAPATTITAHARRQAALRDYAMSKGYEYLPVFEAFTNQPDGGASLVMALDGIHPTVSNTTDITTWCGNLLWAAVWLNIINSRRQVGTLTPITGLP